MMKKPLFIVGGILLAVGIGFTMIITALRATDAKLGSDGFTGDGAILVGIVCALMGLVLVIRASFTFRELDINVGPVEAKLGEPATEPEPAPQQTPQGVDANLQGPVTKLAGPPVTQPVEAPK